MYLANLRLQLRKLKIMFKKGSVKSSILNKQNVVKTKTLLIKRNYTNVISALKNSITLDVSVTIKDLNIPKKANTIRK